MNEKDRQFIESNNKKKLRGESYASRLDRKVTTTREMFLKRFCNMIIAFKEEQGLSPEGYAEQLGIPLRELAPILSYRYDLIKSTDEVLYILDRLCLYDDRTRERIEKQLGEKPSYFLASL